MDLWSISSLVVKGKKVDSLQERDNKLVNSLSVPQFSTSSFLFSKGNKDVLRIEAPAILVLKHLTFSSIITKWMKCNPNWKAIQSLDYNEVQLFISKASGFCPSPELIISPQSKSTGRGENNYLSLWCISAFSFHIESDNFHLCRSATT